MNPKLLNTLSTPHLEALEWRNLVQKLESTRSKRPSFLNSNWIAGMYAIGALVCGGLAFYGISIGASENMMLSEIQWIKSLFYPEELTVKEIRTLFYSGAAFFISFGGLFAMKIKTLSITEDNEAFLKKWETNKDFRSQYQKNEEAFATLNSICDRLRPHLRTLPQHEIENYLFNLSISPWAKDLLNEELARRENLGS